MAVRSRAFLFHKTSHCFTDFIFLHTLLHTPFICPQCYWENKKCPRPGSLRVEGFVMSWQKIQAILGLVVRAANQRPVIALVVDCSQWAALPRAKRARPLGSQPTQRRRGPLSMWVNALYRPMPPL